MQNKTIFDKLGGQANIDAAVVKFYQKVLSDPSVSHYFKNTDMKKQTENQQKFLTMAFGGPNHYTGRDMKAGHAGLGITTAAFNTVNEIQILIISYIVCQVVIFIINLYNMIYIQSLENILFVLQFNIFETNHKNFLLSYTIVKHLGDTLKEMGVPAEVIAEAAAVAESTRADIVEVK